MTELPAGFDDLQQQVLWELRHDDDKQVFELWWAVNTTYPLLPLSERLRLAELIVADLLDSGEASLYRLSYSQQTRSEVLDQAAAILEVGAWLPLNETDDRVWIEAKSAQAQ